ncbi:MAG: type II toxin-antitoxin system RelE/ParE family toxin [Mesorhizobium sp.]|nr:type II toxin-antitoxin system RelE/ParE family toxin [Mesorhizobium sp.]MCO5162990.1 type II toxin-antitoxin system RelE/ParE family toxin [Mesorhizobium sp.]
MTLPLRISAQAQRDLEQIWAYSAENWGEDQAVQYVAQVRAALELLRTNPGLARPAEDVRPGLRKFTVGSHVLYVRLGDRFLRLVRVLHGRMDAGRHL